MAISRSELILRGRIFNTATPLASANLFPADITFDRQSAMLSVYCCFTVSGVLSVIRTIGGVTVTEILNAGYALNAGCAYGFDLSYQGDTTLNFKYSAGSGTTLVFIVDERTS